MFQRAKWWEVAKTETENRLFKILSRNDKFKWRSIVTVSKELGIEDPEELENLLAVFITNRIIMIRKSEKGVYLGYWEVVEEEVESCKCNKHEFVEEEGPDVNVI
jgi:hypothetical protein